MKHELIVSVIAAAVFVFSSPSSNVCFAQSAGNGGPTSGNTDWGGNSGNPPNNPIGKFHPSTPQRPDPPAKKDPPPRHDPPAHKDPPPKDPKKGSEPAK
jgi:hypothetical protein